MFENDGKFFWTILGIIAVVLTMLFSFLSMDRVGNCISDGGVWDDDQKICRYDCRAWTKELGCISLDEGNHKN